MNDKNKESKYLASVSSNGDDHLIRTTKIVSASNKKKKGKLTPKAKPRYSYNNDTDKKRNSEAIKIPQSKRMSN